VRPAASAFAAISAAVAGSAGSNDSLGFAPSPTSRRQLTGTELGRDDRHEHGSTAALVRPLCGCLRQNAQSK
jgi:hypothetical protein